MPFNSTVFLTICTNDSFAQFKRRANMQKNLNYKHITLKLITKNIFFSNSIE